MRGIPGIAGSDQGLPATVPAWAWVVAFLGIISAVFGITWMWFGMRDVMDVGGFCAEGGPYEIRQECPDGTLPLIMGGVWITLIGSLAAAIGLSRISKGSLALILLAWAGLFLALGWNFWDYGLNPPETGGDTTGWIICGVLFVLMGLPALVGLPIAWKKTDAERRAQVFGILLVAVVVGIYFGNMTANAIR